MDDELLERLIKEAGWTGIYTQWVNPTERESVTVPVTREQIVKFAKLVAGACAKVCDGHTVKSGRNNYSCNDCGGVDAEDAAIEIRKLFEVTT